MKNSIKLFIMCFALITASCNNTENKNQSKNNQRSENQIEQEQTTLSISYILENADSLKGKLINVKGIVDHICEHSRNRFKIINSQNGDEFKIIMQDNLTDFNESAIGKNIVITGFIKFTHLNIEDVNEWEVKMKKNHAKEKGTDHYKEELAYIINIKEQIKNKQIDYYTQYYLDAINYKFQ